MEEMRQAPAETAEGERERFREVWRRVEEAGGGAGPVEALPAEEQRLAVPDPGAGLERRCGELRAALGEALKAASAYGGLARRLGDRPGGRRLRALSAAARRSVEPYSIEYFAQSLEDIYLRQIARRNGEEKEVSA